MNTPMKQRMDETMDQLAPQYQSELLDFGDFLNAKQQASLVQPLSVEEARALLREIVKSLPKGRLGSPYLDLTGFKFNREEANERTH